MTTKKIEIPAEVIEGGVEELEALVEALELAPVVVAVLAAVFYARTCIAFGDELEAAMDEIVEKEKERCRAVERKTRGSLN